MILNPIRRLSEIRTAKGFGVHSPFAYRFITEVLFQPCAYYAYDSIEPHHYDLSTLRRLYRIFLYLAPEEIDFNNFDDDVAYVRHIAWQSSLRQSSYKKAYVCTKDVDEFPSDANLLIAIGGECVHSLIPGIKNFLDRKGVGMFFFGKKLAVAVVDPKLPRQNFRLPI